MDNGAHESGNIGVLEPQGLVATRQNRAQENNGLGQPAEVVASGDWFAVSSEFLKETLDRGKLTDEERSRLTERKRTEIGDATYMPTSGEERVELVSIAIDPLVKHMDTKEKTLEGIKRLEETLAAPVGVEQGVQYGAVLAIAKQKLEQFQLDEKVNAVGGMDLPESSTGPTVAEYPHVVDSTTVTGGVQTEPGNSQSASSVIESEVSEANEPREKYGLGALNRTQLAAVKAESRRRRHVEAPVRARTPFRDEPLSSMSTDTKNSLSVGSSVPAIESVTTTPSTDAPKLTDEEYRVKLGTEPLDMSPGVKTKEQAPNLTALENTTAWDGSSASLPAEETVSPSMHEHVTNDSSRVARLTERLGSRVKEVVKENRGKIARVVASGMMMFIGIHDDALAPGREGNLQAVGNGSQLTGEIVSDQPAVSSDHVELAGPEVASDPIPEPSARGEVASVTSDQPIEAGVTQPAPIPNAEAVSPSVPETAVKEQQMERFSHLGERKALPTGSNYSQELITRSQGSLTPESVKTDILDNADYLVTTVLLNETPILTSQKEGKKIDLSESQLITLANQALDASNVEQQAAAKNTLEEYLGYIIADPPQQMTLANLEELKDLAPEVVKAVKEQDLDSLHAIISVVGTAPEGQTTPAVTSGTTPADGGITPAPEASTTAMVDGTTPAVGGITPAVTEANSEANGTSPAVGEKPNEKKGFFSSLFGGGND